MKNTLSKKQGGQALPIGIATILFITMLSLLMFNTNQTISEKMRLTNTADAAVYSSMLWGARVLNFHGYTNRAMVANQVSIAQLVSFVSWGTYVKNVAVNIGTIASIFPPARIIFMAIIKGAKAANRMIKSISSAAVIGIDFLLKTLSIAQETVHLMSAGVMVEVLYEVVKRNDPKYKVSLVSGVDITKKAFSWVNGFTKRYKSNKGLQRKADMIMRSRDPWSKRRAWDAGTGFSLFGYGYSVSLNKEGTTKLLAAGNMKSKTSRRVKWEWKAKDTLSLHFSWSAPFKSGSGEIPIAWGGAFASTTRNDFEPQYTNWRGRRKCTLCRHYWSRNKNSEDILRAIQRGNNYKNARIRGYHGVRNYREVADLTKKNKDPRHSLSIVVEIPGGARRTSSKIKGLGSKQKNNPTPSRNGIQKGMFSMEDNFAKGAVDGKEKMTALSKAEIFFKRPQKLGKNRNGKQLVEYGNLFNPYWDVHLVAPDISDRELLWVAQAK